MKFFYKFLASGLVCSLSLSIQATTLPVNQELLPVEGGGVVDPQLAQWLKEHTNVPNPMEMSFAQFNQAIKSYDSLSVAFLKLRRANATAPTSKAAHAALKSALAIVNDEKNIQQKNHPLYPYLLQEVIEAVKSTKKETELSLNELEKYGDRSCPRKDYFLKSLPHKTDPKLSLEQLTVSLDKLLHFQSPRFRNEALPTFLDAVTENHQAGLRDKLFPVVSSNAKLLEDNLWLLGDDESKAEELGLKEPFKTLRLVSQNVTRKRCRTAKLAYIDLLKEYKNKPALFDRFQQTALRLEECFPGRGNNSPRDKFWQELAQPLEEAFGFPGKELADRKLALLQWARDNFEPARKTFQEIAEKAAKKNFRDIEANALFTLARIEENADQVLKSIEHYQEFVEKFPSSEKFLDAEMALVLLNSTAGKINDALANAKAIIESQDKLALDKRSSGAMSFALFWAAKLSISANNIKMAKVYLERVATDYYSTFYGAMGHYLFERIENKALSLSPTRSAPFDQNALFGHFAAAEQPTVQRVLALLKIGLRDEASCEVSELVVRDNENERIASKALFQYATGEWLAAIRNFDSLPRSFRNGLPSGFERILFPRTFDKYVDNYAQRVGLDPDLIFAIIRQESVFNPRANSSAGAQGLMQLMPATARVEAKRLSKNYIDSAQKGKIKRLAVSTDNLFDANFNIALGVHHVSRLLGKFQNPIIVLASYNANPSAAQRWLQNIPNDDILAFIERIPYGETRTYVKLVLRNYFYYKRWYRPVKNEPMKHLEVLAENLLGPSKTSKVH